MWTIKPGFHKLVSDVGIVSVAECFVKRSGQSYGNTLAIVSDDLSVRSKSTVPFLRPDCVTKNSVTGPKNSRDDPYVGDNCIETRLKCVYLCNYV